MIDELDKKVIAAIQGDLPLDLKPFAVLAERIGIAESELIHRILSLKQRGIMRRFGATLRHQEAGFNSNAMVAWVVPEDRITEVGRMMARYREVTHCYQRVPQGDLKYNLYSMIHAETRDECYEIVRRISKQTSIQDYALLFSEKEFKKTSMKYF
jgi:DNA-binding Lrp family transcriptional regulator